MNKKIFIAGIIFSLLMGISGIYALTTSVDELSPFSTGIISIDLKEFTLDTYNNEELYAEKERMVGLGDEISFIPRVLNLGDKCYIRAKINVDSSWVSENELIPEISEDWKKIDSYYYYLKPLEKGKSSDIFSKIKIPESISSNNIDTKIVIKIYAEAIQYKNFEPDYSSNNPWLNEDIEECISKNYVIDDDGLLSKLNIKYENGANKSVKISEHFFDGLKNIYPGDEFEEKVTIINNSKNKQKYYFDIDADKLTQEEKELLDKMTLIIRDKKEKIIYQGSLYNCKETYLGTFDIKNGNDFVFKISVPKDLKNKYSALNFELCMKFSAVDFEDGGKAIPDNKSELNMINQNNDDNNSISDLEKQNKKTPKTGDTITKSLILFFVSALGLFITIILAYSEKKNIKIKK